MKMAAAVTRPVIIPGPLVGRLANEAPFDIVKANQLLGRIGEVSSMEFVTDSALVTAAIVSSFSAAVILQQCALRLMLRFLTRGIHHS